MAARDEREEMVVEAEQEHQEHVPVRRKGAGVAEPCAALQGVCRRLRACDASLLDVDLEGQKLPASDVMMLVRAIEEAPVVAVRRLSVAGNEVGDKAIQSLYNVLYACPHLTELDISRTGIDEHTMAVLGNYVRKSFSLTTVRANQRKAGERGEHLDEKPSLCPGCHASTVNVNYFLESNRSLQECAAGKSSRAVLSARRLEELPAAFTSLTRLQHTLKELYLCNNNLTDIPEALNGLTLLEHLDLSGNYISTVQRFTRSVHPQLRSLCLEDNLLDGYEVHVVLEAHKNMPRLALVDLRSNALPSVHCLRKALTKKSESIKYVYVSGNPMYDAEEQPPHVVTALRKDGAAVAGMEARPEADAPADGAPEPELVARRWLPALPFSAAAADAPEDPAAAQLHGFPQSTVPFQTAAAVPVRKLVLRAASAEKWRRPRFTATVSVRYCVLQPVDVARVVAAADAGDLEQACALETARFRLVHHVARDSVENALRSMREGEAAVFDVQPRARVCASAFRPLIGSEQALEHNIMLVILDSIEESSAVCSAAGCICKSVLKMAPPERKPVAPKANSICGVHYSIRSMCGLLLFPNKAKGMPDRRNVAPNVLTLKLDSSRTPEFFRVAVRSMESGEVAQFRVCSKWLSEGLQPGGGREEDWAKLIAAAPNVLLDVHLIHVADQRDEPVPDEECSVSEHLLWVRNKLHMGASAYKKQSYDCAVQQYEEALARLDEVQRAETAVTKPSFANDVKLLRQNLHISLAAVAIRRGDYDRAMHYCSLDGCDAATTAPFRSEARFACVCLKEGELAPAARVIDKFLAAKDKLSESDLCVLEKLNERRKRLHLEQRCGAAAGARTGTANG